MKDKHFHLPNEGSEGLESFALLFYAHINMAFWSAVINYIAFMR